jgi:hypothetical protein
MKTTNRMLQRICGEFLEMPGLTLTLRQAQRLWTLDEPICRHLLDSLVSMGFLRCSAKGVYARCIDGLVGGPGRKMAKAEFTEAGLLAAHGKTR